MQASPFPCLTKHGIVVDEECQCGALRTDHASSEIAFGHGAHAPTACQAFTWRAFRYGASPEPKVRVSAEKERELKAIELIVDEPLTDSVWNALASLTIVELRATAAWLQNARTAFEKAASDALINAVATSG